MGQAKVKNYLVGVQYGENDNVISVCKVCNINELTFNTLKNKNFEYQQKLAKEKIDLLNTIDELKDKLDQLEKEIKILKGEE